LIPQRDKNTRAICARWHHSYRRSVRGPAVDERARHRIRPRDDSALLGAENAGIQDALTRLYLAGRRIMA
jgi:hypothetical protein